MMVGVVPEVVLPKTMFLRATVERSAMALTRQALHMSMGLVAMILLLLSPVASSNLNGWQSCIR
jgi:hypothetical protein